MADRYYVEVRNYPTARTPKTWLVMDRVTGLVAKDTAGSGGRPGGYATKAEAQNVCDRKNRSA